MQENESAPDDRQEQHPQLKELSPSGVACQERGKWNKARPADHLGPLRAAPLSAPGFHGENSHD
jgi:hypothetical protein